MYLPRLDNNKKKEKTLYDAGASNYTQLIQESLYPSESDLQEAINALSHKDFETANQVVKTRSRKIAIAIADSILG